MKNLQINEKTARELYPKASEEFKKVLEDSFGKEFFSQKITDRIKTFEDACELLNIDSSIGKLDSDSADIQAYKQLKIIVEALNEGWKPNWNDSNERKWYPYFDMRTSSGFGFSHSDFGRWTSSTTVGSRLCFKSEELAEYAGKQFTEIYKQFLTL